LVKFDKNLNVTAVETPMGKGSPNACGPGGRGPAGGYAPHAFSSPGTTG
jgi:hypothetical protein